jgi:hypothetical protein
MRITNQERTPERSRGGEPVADALRAPNAPADETPRAGNRDAIEISVEARALHRAEHDGRAASGASVDKTAAASVDVDVERLAAVRERLESGYYETQQVTEAVAHRILELLGLVPREEPPAAQEVTRE